MTDLNPAWLSAAFALLALIAGFLYFRAGRKTKQLRYTTIANQPLITTSQRTYSDALEVRYKDEAVKQPRLVTVRVTNTGKTEIRQADYEKELTLQLGPRARAVASSVLLYDSNDDSGQTLEVEAATASTVTAPKTLLNTGDRLEFTVLVDGVVTEPDVHARIAGTKLLRSTDRDRRSWLAKLGGSQNVVGGVFGAVAILIVFLGTRESSDPRMVAVPNLVNLPIEAATDIVRQESLYVGRIDYVSSDHQICLSAQW